MDLLSSSDNPVPPGAIPFAIRTEDGVALRVARFPAGGNRVRGTVLLCQGRTEQIEKYFAVIAALQSRGLAVVAFDWRGQGGSERLLPDPRKGHVPRFEDYGLDLKALRRQVVLPDCPPPYFGLGHSMGALALLLAAPDLTPFLTRIVLVAPFMELGDEKFSRPAIRRLTGLLRLAGFGSAYAPGGARRVAVPAFDGNVLTSDARRFRIMQQIVAARPDLGLGAPTVAWVNAACRAQDAIEADDFPARVPMPVLIVNAGADRVVSPRAVERLARRLRAPGYVLIPGSRHEVLMERPIFADQFWAAFDAFVPGTPATEFMT